MQFSQCLRNIISKHVQTFRTLHFGIPEDKSPWHIRPLSMAEFLINCFVCFARVAKYLCMHILSLKCNQGQGHDSPYVGPVIGGEGLLKMCLLFLKLF